VSVRVAVHGGDFARGLGSGRRGNLDQWRQPGVVGEHDKNVSLKNEGGGPFEGEDQSGLLSGGERGLAGFRGGKSGFAQGSCAIVIQLKAWLGEGGLAQDGGQVMRMDPVGRLGNGERQGRLASFLEGRNRG